MKKDSQPHGGLIMSVLAEVELRFKETGVQYEKNELGLLVTTVGKFESVVYPVLLSDEDEHLQGLLWFPRPAKTPILKLEEFCQEVQKLFGSHAGFGFNEERGTFYFGAFLNPDAIGKALEDFASSCDILLPLCERIGELGSWDEHLLYLARAIPPKNRKELH